MPKKIILDADPGIIDAASIALAAFDPAVELLAVTSVGGNVPAPIAAKNLQAIIEFLDPPRLPRLGMGTEPDGGLPLDFRHVHGIDGLGGTPLPVAELRSPHTAEKIICDAVRSDPENVMLICMGPLTNVARAFLRDHELPKILRHLYITGGAVNARGNISPCAEFNFYADPVSARLVWHSPCTKTLVPLDITNKILLRIGDLGHFPNEKTKLGTLLRSMFIPAINAYRQNYGLEGVHLHDLITYFAATHPRLFESSEMAGDVETQGQLTRGMTVFDQRRYPELPHNIDVITKIDEISVFDEIFTGLNNASEQIEKG